MTVQDFSIRPETIDDRAKVACMLARTYGVDGVKVIETTSKMRDAAAYDAELALLSERAGKAEAFALFTPVKVGNDEKLGVMMAPLALDERSENVDVGKFLEKAFETVAAKGFRFVFAFGEVEDMSAVGFKDANSIGLKTDGGAGATFIVRDLKPDAGKIEAGFVVCPAEL